MYIEESKTMDRVRFEQIEKKAHCWEILSWYPNDKLAEAQPFLNTVDPTERKFCRADFGAYP